MDVSKIQKKVRISKFDAVKYQIITELIFLRKENLIPTDVELLTLLAIWGPMDLSKFCNAAVKKLYVITEMEEFSLRSQNIRNKMAKLEKRKLIEKSVSGRKQIRLASFINVVSKGNLLIDYNFLAVESTTI